MDSTSSTVRKDGFSVPWWLYLVSSAAWFIIAWVVLRFDLRSVTAISVLAGIVILAAGIAELFNAFTAPGWRWLHALLGGLHLSGPFFAPSIGPTVHALTELAPDLLAPGHCTGWRAQHALAAALPNSWIPSSSGTRYQLTASLPAR